MLHEIRRQCRVHWLCDLVLVAAAQKRVDQLPPFFVRVRFVVAGHESRRSESACGKRAVHAVILLVGDNLPHDESERPPVGALPISNVVADSGSLRQHLGRPIGFASGPVVPDARALSRRNVDPAVTCPTTTTTTTTLSAAARPLLCDSCCLASPTRRLAIRQRLVIDRGEAHVDVSDRTGRRLHQDVGRLYVCHVVRVAGNHAQ